MLHQKKCNTLAHKNFGLEAIFAGLVATLKQNQTRLIVFVDIDNLKTRGMKANELMIGCIDQIAIPK